MIPNLFRKQPLPKNIPIALEKKIKEFSKSKDKELFLKKSFFYIVNKWSGNRINFVLQIHKAFRRDMNKIYSTRGYMHCTTMNYVLRVMAVKSGLFKDSDIELKMTQNWHIAPHQYLRFKISKNKFTTLDPWSYQYGLDYGTYSSSFASFRMSPITKR
jgi:hypothetical protein